MEGAIGGANDVPHAFRLFSPACRMTASTALRATLFGCHLHRRFFAVAAIACLFDLGTKAAAVRYLGEAGFVTLTERLSLLLVWNTGVTGGASIGPLTGVFNVVVTVLAVALVLSVVRPLALLDSRACLSLGLVTGGAMGNLASIVAGPMGVADFIGIHVSHDTTIVANVADFALWSGALLLMPVAATILQRMREQRAGAR